MPLIYQLGDVYVLCSRSETWGLAVNEAMACGLPILVSDKVGCAVDLVKDGENGYIFRSEDTLNLTANLKRIASQREHLSSFRKSSLEKITKWSFDGLCTAIESELLKQIDCEGR